MMEVEMKDWVRAVLSVLSAFLGVQSEENRVRDFEQGRFSVFVVAGLLMTVTFLVSVYGLVQLVMIYVQ
jgi:hypothetical protein